MSDDIVSRWLRTEISTAKAAELMGMGRSEFEGVANAILFAAEEALRALKDVNPPHQAHSDLPLCWCGCAVEKVDEGSNLIIHRSIQEIAAHALLEKMPRLGEVLPSELLPQSWLDQHGEEI